jgi:hypothetical protein
MTARSKYVIIARVGPKDGTIHPWRYYAKGSSDGLHRWEATLGEAQQFSFAEASRRQRRLPDHYAASLQRA